MKALVLLLTAAVVRGSGIGKLIAWSSDGSTNVYENGLIAHAPNRKCTLFLAMGSSRTGATKMKFEGPLSPCIDISGADQSLSEGPPEEEGYESMFVDHAILRQMGHGLVLRCYVRFTQQPGRRQIIPGLLSWEKKSSSMIGEYLVDKDQIDIAGMIPGEKNKEKFCYVVMHRKSEFMRQYNGLGHVGV